jgi:preprotein translocase subunit SecB|tara:strand:+ start:351 stop:773 length:423 start_codon:yes stop_codon:yes gene_type:complete
MSEQFKIITQFVKDMSCETPNVETYLYVKEYLKNYNLNIDITTKPLKNRMIEVNTKLSYSDKGKSKNKSYFEIIYASVVEINEEIKDRKTIEKIILCDTQKEIYPNLEKIFLNLLTSAGFPGIKFEKKIDFEQLYNQRLS